MYTICDNNEVELFELDELVRNVALINIGFSSKTNTYVMIVTLKL